MLNKKVISHQPKGKPRNRSEKISVLKKSETKMPIFEEVYKDEFVKSIKNLDKTTKEIMHKRIQKIIENPHLGKPLTGMAGVFCERFLHYRLIYAVEGKRIVFMRVGKRDSVYRAYD